MMTARGKLQRISLDEVRDTGRNTQGVRLMKLDANDKLVAVKRIPRDDSDSSTETTETDETNNTDL